MPNRREVTTLIEVITRFKEIADKDYEGKVYDNALAVFNKLSINEKRTLLRGLLNICFIVNDKILVNMDDLLEIKEAINATKDTVDIVYLQDKNIKKDIATEIIKLKKTFTYIIIITLIIIILAIITIIFHSDYDFLKSLVMEGYNFVKNFITNL